MVRNIASLTLDSWNRINEYICCRSQWFHHDKDDPVLSCVTTYKHGGNMYYCTVNFYRRNQPGKTYDSQAPAA